MENTEIKKSRLNREVIKNLRDAFVRDLEELFSNPAWLSSDSDNEILENIKNGGKVPAGGYLEDIIIGIAMRVARIYSDEDFAILKQEFIK